MSSEGACAAFARFLVEFRADSSVSDELAGLVGRRVFDTLGALAAGRTVADADVLSTASLRRWPQIEALSELGEWCASIRCSEVDDIDTLGCVTPGSVVVPVAVMVGSAIGADGDTLVLAILAGYEAMIRLGEAVNGPEILRSGVWPSYVVAPFAAAATAACMLGLGVEATAHALAIAASRSVGMVGQILGSPTSRWLLFGWAVTAGVAAAQAAEVGLRGDLDAVERHLAAPAGGQVAVDVLTARDGSLRCKRVDVKPFCTARQVWPAIEAARQARQELGASGLERVEVAVPAAYVRMLDQPRPANRLASITSAQFQLGAALASPHMLFNVARREIRPSPAAANLMRLTSVMEDPELTPLYPRLWPARVALRTTDGREAVRLVRAVDAHQSPASAWQALEAKHRALGGWNGKLEAALATCRNLRPGIDPSWLHELVNLTTVRREASK